jgi:hypothetical protein
MIGSRNQNPNLSKLKWDDKALLAFKFYKIWLNTHFMLFAPFIKLRREPCVGVRVGWFGFRFGCRIISSSACNRLGWTFGRGHHALRATLPCPGWPWSSACVLAGPACRVGHLWSCDVVSSPPVPLSCPRAASVACLSCLCLRMEASAPSSALVLPLLVSLSLTLLLAPPTMATN